MKKTMLTVFYDSRGVVAWHLLPERIKTVNSAEYIACIKFLLSRVRNKRPESTENSGFGDGGDEQSGVESDNNASRGSEMSSDSASASAKKRRGRLNKAKPMPISPIPKWSIP